MILYRPLTCDSYKKAPWVNQWKGHLATLISWIANQDTSNKKEKMQTSTELHLLCQNPIGSVPSLGGVPEHSGCQLVGLCSFFLYTWALDSWRFSICWNTWHRNGYLWICHSNVFSSQLLTCCQHNPGPPSSGLLNTGAVPAKAYGACTSHFIRVRNDNKQCLAM